MATLRLMHPLIETHRAELLALARRRGIAGVRVFGSMSRGDGGDDSDVDLLVTLAPVPSPWVACCWMRRICWVAVWMSSPKRACTLRCASE